MKIILPALTLMLASLAAESLHAQRPRIASVEHPGQFAVAGTASEPQSPGDRLINQVIAQLEQRQSVAARLRYHASIDGRRLAGAGSYWQEGSGNVLKMRLELRIAGQTNLLQVSNGRFMWTDVSLPTGRDVVRLDLRQIRSDAKLSDPEFDGISPGQASWSPLRPDTVAFTGGLPALITSLAENFTFSRPQAMRWTPAPPLPGMAESLPVFAMVGRWKRDQLLLLMPKLAERSDELEIAIPEHVPQEVLLLIGQSDSFPYRVEYRRLNDPAVSTEAVNGRSAYQLSGDPLVLVEHYDVAYDTQVAVDQFDYSPGDVEWSDKTAETLDALRAQRRQQFARRSGNSETR